jgi:hypothetical protein
MYVVACAVLTRLDCAACCPAWELAQGSLKAVMIWTFWVCESSCDTCCSFRYHDSVALHSSKRTDTAGEAGARQQEVPGCRQMITLRWVQSSSSAGSSQPSMPRISPTYQSRMQGLFMPTAAACSPALQQQLFHSSNRQRSNSAALQHRAYEASRQHALPHTNDNISHIKHSGTTALVLLQAEPCTDAAQQKASRRAGATATP